MGQIKKNGVAQMPIAGRNYKSTVFAMLFGDRERLLKLYNAISGKKLSGSGRTGDQHLGECHLYGNEK